MKKIIVLLFFVTVLIALTSGNTSGVLIPSDAIRFRIIANSNSLEDQTTKINIRKEIEPVFAEILEASTSKEETKELILSTKILDINKFSFHFVKKIVLSFDMVNYYQCYSTKLY